MPTSSVVSCPTYCCSVEIGQHSSSAQKQIVQYYSFVFNSKNLTSMSRKHPLIGELSLKPIKYYEKDTRSDNQIQSMGCLHLVATAICNAGRPNFSFHREERCCKKTDRDSLRSFVVVWDCLEVRSSEPRTRPNGLKCWSGMVGETCLVWVRACSGLIKNN